MPRKNNTTRRKDRKGRVLRTGKSQRKDGTYDYRYTDKDHNRHSIYATTLEELQKKEAEVLICTMLGIDITKGDITVSELVERYIIQKRNVRYTTRSGYWFVLCSAQV